MIFAVVACAVCAVLCYFAFRSRGHRSEVDEVARLSASVKRRRRSKAELGSGGLAGELGTLLQVLDSTATREASIAALNEFTLELESRGPRGPEVARGLGRACFSAGLLLGALAIADALQAAERVGSSGLVAGVVAVLAGGLGGMFCYQLGQVASRRRREYYEHARGLVGWLKRQIPADDLGR